MVPLLFFNVVFHIVRCQLGFSVPWKLSTIDNDAKCSDFVKEYLNTKIEKFNCTCNSSCFNDKQLNILVVFFRNSAYIYRQISNFEAKLLSKIGPTWRKKKFKKNKVIRKLNRLLKNGSYLNVCFTDTEDNLLKDKITKKFTNVVTKITFFDKHHVNISSPNSAKIILRNSITCECLLSKIFDELECEVLQKIYCKQTCEKGSSFEEFFIKLPESFSQASLQCQLLSLFTKYNSYDLFWNLLHYLTNDDQFSRYFIFYFETSSENLSSDEQMNWRTLLKNIQQYKYWDTEQVFGKNEIDFFMYIYENIFFKMNFFTKFEIISQILENNLKNKFFSFIREIKDSILSILIEHKNVIYFMISPESTYFLLMNNKEKFNNEISLYKETVSKLCNKVHAALDCIYDVTLN